MKSPAGGTSCLAMSMRTSGGQPAARYLPLVWQAYRDEAGQLKFKRIKERPREEKAGPVEITATIPNRVLKDGARLRGLVDAIRREGGSVTHARGRLLSVSGDSGAAAGIGDALDSFGCQWDAQ